MTYHSKIQQVKENIDIIQVARYFNINLNRANKCCCIFHNEKTASMSFHQDKQIFKCFGCGVSGDVITLTSKILNANAYEAAKQLNDIFRLGVDFKQKTNRSSIENYKQKQNKIKQFEHWIDKAYITLCEYRLELIKTNNEETWEKLSTIEYYLDWLFDATDKEKLLFYKLNRNVVNELGR